MDRFLSSGLCSGVEIAADGPGDQAATTGAMIMGSIAHFAESWPSTRDLVAVHLLLFGARGRRGDTWDWPPEELSEGHFRW